MHTIHCLRNSGVLAAAAALLAAMAALATTAHAAESVETKVVKTAGGFELQRDGKAYFIKGVGGDGSKTLLAACGGNSFRTWGIGKDTQAQLDEAQKLGLTVTLGIWLGHKEHGFNWSDKSAVKKQFDDAQAAVAKYKDHPALLVWALGNEMENGDNTPELWQAIEDLAKMAHQADPKHPTMTVVAEIGGKTLENIKKHCPDLDIVGINTYGGGPSVGERFKKADMARPYIITEFGPAGTWEIGRNAFGAADELTSTAKAAAYRATYVKSVAGQAGLCLGSYAFTWGFKREATATWYGLLLPDGSKLGGVDALSELWAGKPLGHLCPEMTRLAVTGASQVAPGQTIKAVVEAKDPAGDKLTIQWALFREMSDYNVTGTGAKPTTDFSNLIVANGKNEVEIKAPAEGGVYRIYCYLHNPHESAAVGSLPIKVAKDAPPTQPAK